MFRGGMTTHRDRISTVTFLSGAAIVLAVFLLHGDPEAWNDWNLPPTPPAASNPAGVKRWTLLQKAGKVIPLQATFTVRSSNLESEMDLYMMAQGILVRRISLPSSYDGAEKGEGEGAEFVIAEFPLEPNPKLIRVALFPEGAVYRRIRH